MVKWTFFWFTYPLLVQLQQLFWDLGGVESQPQTLDIKFRNDIL